MSLTQLEVVDVEQHEPERLLEAPGALDLGRHRLLEAAAVEQAGELVGDRLALDRLVQPDVLDRDRGLAGEVVEELALLGAERAALARDGHDARDPRLVLVAPQRMRQGADVVDLRVARLAGLEDLRLGGADRLVQPLRRRRVIATCSSGSVSVGRTDARPASASTPSTAVAHDDLEQRLAVEVRRERLADRAHRGLQARALGAQVREAVLQLARHLVELDAERRELVVALGRHGRGEVAAADAAGRLQEAAHLALQRARDEQAERDRDEQERGEEQAADEPAPARAGGEGRLRREQVDLHARAQEPVDDERERPVLLAVDGRVAALRRLGDGRRSRRPATSR